MWSGNAVLEVFLLQLQCDICGVEEAGMVPWVEGPRGTSFGFYLREAFQRQTHMEKILYSESR